MKFNSFIENLLYPPFAKFIHNLNDCFKETILNFLLAFLGKITKSKVFILPETLEKILKFVENNFHFEKNLEILNISNKSKNKIKIVYLLLNSYISQINFSTNKFSFTEIENIYSNLTKIKIEYSKKLEESYEFNYTFLEEDNHRHKLNASMIDQCKKLKENSKKIEMPDMANLIAPNDLKSSKKVVKLDDNSFITKDGIFFTSFKNEQKFNFRSKEDSLKTDFENDKNEQISLEDIN